MTSRSNQRLTVTMGEAAVRRARSTTSLSAAGRSGNNSGSANHGTADTTWRVCNRSPSTSTPATAPSITRTFAAALVRTAPPRRSRYSRAGSAYIRCRGLVGSAIAAARGSGPNISASTRANTGAAAWSGFWFSAASASGSHSSSRIRGVCPLRMSQFSTVSPDDAAFRVAPGRSSRRAILSGDAIPNTDSRSRHDSASHSITPATTCSGGGSAGHESRVRRPDESIMVTPSCGSTRTLSSASISARNAKVSA